MEKNKKINLRNIIVEELYKPVRINFKTRRVEVKGFNDLLCLDIADMQKLKKENSGYAYFLLGVNAFSRKIFTEPLKTKTGKEVANATLKIIERAKTRFRNIWVDKGSEFHNRDFKYKVLEPLNINLYSTYTGKKSVLAERNIRTIKTRIYKNLDMLGTNNWIQSLSKLTNEINNRKHSRFGFIPNKIHKKDEKLIMRKFYSRPREMSHKTKFKIGDCVRISSPPKIFRRAFMPYWSTSLYSIKAINRKIPNVYVLEDHEGNELKRKYYEEELQKTNAKDIWLVEKIVKRRGKKILVRYLGFSEKYDQWVDAKDFFEV